MGDFPDYEAACEAEAQTVYAMKFVELVPQQQVLVRRSVENILAAALRDKPLYQVDRTHERKRTTEPVKYVQVWPKEINNDT